jgi:hypothetical protein
MARKERKKTEKKEREEGRKGGEREREREKIKLHSSKYQVEAKENYLAFHWA